jgi:hypothetical protein
LTAQQILETRIVRTDHSQATGRQSRRRPSGSGHPEETAAAKVGPGYERPDDQAENGNTLWWDANVLEMSNVRVAFKEIAKGIDEKKSEELDWQVELRRPWYGRQQAKNRTK